MLTTRSRGLVGKRLRNRQEFIDAFISIGTGGFIAISVTVSTNYTVADDVTWVRPYQPNNAQPSLIIVP